MVQRLGKILDFTLATLHQEIENRQQLETIILAMLPDQLRPYCRLGRFHQGCLHLAVADGTWITLLRYQVPLLREKLRQHPAFHGLCSIDLKTHPDIASKRPLKRFSCKDPES